MDEPLLHAPAGRQWSFHPPLTLSSPLAEGEHRGHSLLHALLLLALLSLQLSILRPPGAQSPLSPTLARAAAPAQRSALSHPRPSLASAGAGRLPRAAVLPLGRSTHLRLAPAAVRRSDAWRLRRDGAVRGGAAGDDAGWVSLLSLTKCARSGRCWSTMAVLTSRCSPSSASSPLSLPATSPHRPSTPGCCSPWALSLSLTQETDAFYASSALSNNSDAFYASSALSNNSDPSYLSPSLLDNTDAPTTLLRLLRDQLALDDPPDPSSLLAAFLSHSTQLKLLQNAESLLSWRPRADDPRCEPFPTLLAGETTPFRHGPPGCEDLLRELFLHAGERLLRWLLSDLATVSERLAEADCYIIGQFLCEMAAEWPENPPVGVSSLFHADDDDDAHAGDAGDRTVRSPATISSLAAAGATNSTGADETPAAAEHADGEHTGGSVLSGERVVGGTRTELRGRPAADAGESSQPVAIGDLLHSPHSLRRSWMRCR